MSTRRPLFGPLVLSLLVGITGCLLAGSAFAAAPPVRSTRVIALGGTVDGPPESVAISGNVQIKSIMVPDPDFATPPVVLLTFDFLNVSGQGLKTGSTYITGGDQSALTRPLKASDVVQITFPFFTRSGGILSARAGLATFDLTFDVNNGALKQAIGSVSTPNFP